MTLEGHRDAPTCLSFSHSTEPVLLISCARDYVIKWNVTECLINQHNGKLIFSYCLVVGHSLSFFSYTNLKSTDKSTIKFYVFTNCELFLIFSSSLPVCIKESFLPVSLLAILCEYQYSSQGGFHTIKKQCYFLSNTSKTTNSDFCCKFFLYIKFVLFFYI